MVIKERILGENHPSVAISLNGLAMLYDSQGKYEKAESLYQNSLVILEKALGKNHPDVAVCLNNLAEIYRVQGTRLPISFLDLYSICYVGFSITLILYLKNQHITGYHRIDVEAIPCAPEQIKTLKTSKPFRNTCTSVDS